MDAGTALPHLITDQELQALLAGPEERRPVLVDVRWALGSPAERNRAAYLAEHLPGAAFLDLEEVLSDPVREDRVGGRHPMPADERVARGFREAGIRRDRPVVFYDAGPGLGAARAWWIARYHHLEAAVLEGGLTAWQDAGLVTSSGGVEVAPGDVEPDPGGRELMDADDVAALVADGGTLLDSRPADRFRGENETMDPVAGRIPGAVSLPVLPLVVDGRIAGAEELLAALEGAQENGQEDATADTAPTAVYCGSGVQACLLALALEARGVGPRPAVYIGSFSDWISDPDRPVATGEPD